MPILGVMASQISGHLSGPSYDSIATVTIGTPDSIISFSSIPATYKHLQLRISGRGNRALFLDNPIMKFNSDATTSNYYQHGWYGDGANVTPASDGSSWMLMYALAGNNAGANIFGAMVTDIIDYTNTNKYKTTKYLGGVDNNGQGIIGFGSGGWFDTSAITSLTLVLSTGANFLQYTSVALYGIKG